MCTARDDDTECVDGAVCKNVAAKGLPEDQRCLCKQGFHKKTPFSGGTPTCEASTCVFFAAVCFGDLSLFCYPL